MQASKVQRLDVVQRATVWTSRTRMEGVKYDVVIDGLLAEFRAEAGGTQQFSELEEKVIWLLPQQTVVLQETSIPLAEIQDG